MILQWFPPKEFYKLPVSAEKKSWRFPYFCKICCQRKIGIFVGHPVCHMHAHDFSTPVHSLSFWDVNISKTCMGTETANSFFPCIATLWNSVPAYCFPLNYNLLLFKGSISMHLASLTITWKPTNKNIDNFIRYLNFKLINWFEKW